MEKIRKDLRKYALKGEDSKVLDELRMRGENMGYHELKLWVDIAERIKRKHREQCTMTTLDR